jgi:hypothetical protein
MNLTKSQQSKKKLAATIGFWSALLLVVLNLWYFIAFVLYQPILHARWPGLAAYAAHFQPAPLLIWVVPTFFIGPVFLVMIACLYAWTGEEKQVWSLLALVFAVAYTAVLSPNYYIQMTMVPHNLANGITDGMTLWLYADPFYPYTIPGALEGVGFAFTGLSFLFASAVFEGGKLERWVRWTFFGTGLSALVAFVDPLIRLPLVIVFGDLFAAAVLLTLAPVLLAVLLRRSKYSTVAVAQG